MTECTSSVTPRVVATHLLNLVDRDSGEAITHLKLQKLVYYCQAWYLANFDTPLFEEDFQAWAHGPVARSVYDRFKGNQWAALEASGKSRLPSEYHDFVAAVYDEYGQFGAKKLEKMTHEEAPWRDVRGSLPPEARCEDIIPKIEIRNFYAKILGKKPLKKL